MNNCPRFIGSSRCKSFSGGCKPSTNLNTLSDIVAHHASKRGNCADEFRFYRNQLSFHKAIEVSALSYGADGKRLSHQYRLSRNTLIKWASRLQRNSGALRRCKKFHELFLLIERHGKDTYGIGELTIYDTSQRVGIYLDMEPEYVYLHAGTRSGAKALGLDYEKPWLSYNELPKAFRKLRPCEIEDCLCIYKHLFNMHMRFE